MTYTFHSRYGCEPYWNSACFLLFDSAGDWNDNDNFISSFYTGFAMILVRMSKASLREFAGVVEDSPLN